MEGGGTGSFHRKNLTFLFDIRISKSIDFSYSVLFLIIFLL